MPPLDTFFHGLPHKSEAVSPPTLWADCQLDGQGRIIKDPASRARFEADIHTFETRMQSIDPAASNKFYEQVGRLLSARPSRCGLTAAQRMELAQEVVNHGAYPDRIDQGHHGTCGAAALEAEMYTRDPADAARIVASVALDGCFITADGKTSVRPRPSTLKPDDEASCIPTKDGWRDFASQVFQESAITVVYPSFHEVNRARTDDDTGERIFVAQGKTPHLKYVEKPFVGLDPVQVQQVNRALTGDRNPLAIIENARFNGDDGQVHVASEQALKNTLVCLSAKRTLPALLEINVGHEPFYGQVHETGWHYVSLTGYDSKTGTVTVDNQWGKDSDLGGVSAQEVFLATDDLDNQSLKQLQQEVLKNRKCTMDILLELELIRREKSQHLLRPAEYKQHLEILMYNARAQWMEQQRQGKPDSPERKRTMGELQYAVQHLPPEDRREVERLNILALPSRTGKG